jgi:hypothetical protein
VFQNNGVMVVIDACQVVRAICGVDGLDVENKR